MTHSTVLFTFASSKSFGHQLNIYFTSKSDLHRNILFRVTYIEIWFTDQNSIPLEKFFCKRSNSFSSKYGQKLLDATIKLSTDAVKTASTRTIPKIAEAAAGDLVGNKIAKTITKRNREDPKKLTVEKISMERHIRP